MTVQVEVSIQDCFWEQLENSENNTIPNDALESSPREIDCPLTITEWEQ